jgi:hypothetical protein
MAHLSTPENAFASALPGISPRGLIEALNDPQAIRNISRGDLYYQLGRLREYFMAADVPVTQRLQYVQLLSKLADVLKPEPLPPTAANLPQIHISMPQYPTDYRPGLPEKYRQPLFEMNELGEPVLRVEHLTVEAEAFPDEA